jgi:hypothetical protein
VATARRLRLRAATLRVEAWLADAVTVAMAVMTVATVVWRAALANAAPWFLAGKPVGSSASPTCAGAHGRGRADAARHPARHCGRAARGPRGGNPLALTKSHRGWMAAELLDRAERQAAINRRHSPSAVLSRGTRAVRSAPALEGGLT